MSTWVDGLSKVHAAAKVRTVPFVQQDAALHEFLYRLGDLGAVLVGQTVS